MRVIELEKNEQSLMVMREGAITPTALLGLVTDLHKAWTERHPGDYGTVFLETRTDDLHPTGLLTIMFKPTAGA